MTQLIKCHVCDGCWFYGFGFQQPNNGKKCLKKYSLTNGCSSCRLIGQMVNHKNAKYLEWVKHSSNTPISTKKNISHLLCEVIQSLGNIAGGQKLGSWCPTTATSNQSVVQCCVLLFRIIIRVFIFITYPKLVFNAGAWGWWWWAFLCNRTRAVCKHLQAIWTVNTSKLGINLVTIIAVKVHFFLNVQGHIKYNEQKDVYSEPSAIHRSIVVCTCNK